MLFSFHIHIFSALYHLNPCLGRQKTPQNMDMGLGETNNLFGENDDTCTSNKAEKTSSFNQAKEFLSKEKHVVITGVQGSGKTFLANRLIDNLKKNKNIIKVAWISNKKQLSQEQKGQIRRMHTYVFYGIFYELQTYRKFKDTLKDLEIFWKELKNPTELSPVHHSSG